MIRSSLQNSASPSRSVDCQASTKQGGNEHEAGQAKRKNCQVQAGVCAQGLPQQWGHHRRGMRRLMRYRSGVGCDCNTKSRRSAPALFCDGLRHPPLSSLAGPRKRFKPWPVKRPGLFLGGTFSKGEAMSTQSLLPLPYPAGHCERIKWRKDLWPTHIKDGAGRMWFVLHIGGIPTNEQPAHFQCHKPGTVEYHTIKDTEAFSA